MMAGTSNFGSWVRTHTASRAPSGAADLGEVAVGPVDDDLVGHREPGRVANTGRASQTVTR